MVSGKVRVGCSVGASGWLLSLAIGHLARYDRLEQLIDGSACRFSKKVFQVTGLLAGSGRISWGFL